MNAEVDALVERLRDPLELDVDRLRTDAAALIERLAASRPAPAPAVGEAERDARVDSAVAYMAGALAATPPTGERLREAAMTDDATPPCLATEVAREIAVYHAALAPRAPEPAAPVWHGCKAGGSVCARYKPTGIGCAEGECDLASGVWASPAPVEPPDWMSERQADWQYGAPVEPPPADCATGHVWSNQFGEDWTPDEGTPCDCGKRRWNVDLFADARRKAQE